MPQGTLFSYRSFLCCFFVELGRLGLVPTVKRDSSAHAAFGGGILARSNIAATVIAIG